MTFSMACARCGKLSVFSNENPKWPGQWYQNCGSCGWFCFAVVTHEVDEEA